MTSICSVLMNTLVIIVNTELLIMRLILEKNLIRYPSVPNQEKKKRKGTLITFPKCKKNTTNKKKEKRTNLPFRLFSVFRSVLSVCPIFDPKKKEKTR